jgi:hypothetical protein
VSARETEVLECGAARAGLTVASVPFYVRHRSPQESQLVCDTRIAWILCANRARAFNSA